MKCQKCGANNANTHVKTVINGEIKEYDLCSECAKKMGYTNIFGNFEDEFSGLLGSFFGNSLPARTQATRCDFCGSSYSDIAKSGHVGCAKCYEIFGDQLLPSIRRFGTKKAEKSAEMTKKDKIKALKKELDKAISEQNFEHAAELRDQIKEMEA